MQGTLNDLLTSIERGTKLHVAVVFVGNHGNEYTLLPQEHTTHKTPFCDGAKELPLGLYACISHRNHILRQAVDSKAPVSGCCINGVFEYCHPVIFGSEVVAVIFVGNIFAPDLPEHKRLAAFTAERTSTLQRDFTLDDCKGVAAVTEGYICYLLERFGDGIKEPPDALIQNVKAYIKENLFYKISLSDIAFFLGYNEKYIGRLFKSKTGQSVKEYVNFLRVEAAKRLLSTTDRPVTEIALAVGFNSVTYFNRVFKELTSLRPFDFRKQFTGGTGRAD